jgi:hypothetical protein
MQRSPVRYDDPAYDDAARERLLDKRRFNGDCWEYAGATRNGYGYFGYRGRPRDAHRVAYQLFVAPIPPGMEIDHLCRNRLCFNPAHLEVVTHQENMRRGGRHNSYSKRTHCVHGHEFTDDNTLITTRGDGRTLRVCRACRVRRDRA